MIEDFIEPETLQNIYDEIIEEEVTRVFTIDELSKMKFELSSITIQLESREKLKAFIANQFTIDQSPDEMLANIVTEVECCEFITEQGIKSLKKEQASLIKKIKEKSYMNKEEIFVIKHYQDRKVATYDSNGYNLVIRAMRPDEFQSNIKNLNTKHA